MNLNHGSGWVRLGPQDPKLGQVQLGWSSGEKVDSGQVGRVHLAAVNDSSKLKPLIYEVSTTTTYSTDLAKTNSCKDNMYLYVIREKLPKCIFSNMVFCHARRIHTPYGGGRNLYFFPSRKVFLFQICLDLLSTQIVQYFLRRLPILQVHRIYNHFLLSLCLTYQIRSVFSMC